MISKLIVPAIFLILSQLAVADTIVIDFSGTLKTESNSYGDTLSIDVPYSGQLVYTLPGVLQFVDVDDSFYSLTGASDGLTISAGSFNSFSSVGTALATQTAEVEYQSNGGDSFIFSSDTPYYQSSISRISIELSLVGSPGFLQSSSMPTEINSADLLQGYGALNTAVNIQEGSNLGGYQQYWSGTVDSIQLTELPEPSSKNLVVLSLLGLGAGIATRRLR